MRLPILEIIWTALMMLIGYGLYTNIMSGIELKEELSRINKSSDQQVDTIKQLQIDLLKVVELANRNAEAYEKVTKDVTSSKVQKVTISNLTAVKKNIKGVINAEDKKSIDNNISVELDRLWNRYKDGSNTAKQ